MTTHITVNSVSEAWQKANEIFPTDYEYDNGSRERTGYEIYRSTVTEHNYDYICDLGDRLEINLSNGDTVNIWIDETETATETVKPSERFEITLTATKTGEIKKFSTYENFIENWRFWFSSGMPSNDEKVFENTMNCLKILDVDSASLQIRRNGLIVEFTIYKW